MPLVCTVDVEDWAQSTLDTNLPITARAGPNMEHVLDILAEEITDTGRMSLHGFGSFSTTPVKEHTRRNPATGEPMVIAAHRRIKFNPAAALSRRVNRAYEDLELVILEDEPRAGLYRKAVQYRETTAVDTPEEGVREKPEPIPVQDPQPVSAVEAYHLQNPPPVTDRRPELPGGIRRILAAMAIEAAMALILVILLIATSPL